MTPSAPSETVKADNFFPATIPIQVTIAVPPDLYPLYAAIKKNFNTTDEKVVTDCVRFAMFCYQQGLVGKAGTLMDALMNQVSAFAVLRERVQQSSAAAKQASFVSSSVVTALELVKRQRRSFPR